MSLEDSWRGAGISYGCLHWCLLRSRLFCGVPRSASFVCMNSAGITEVCWSFEMHSLLALRALFRLLFFTLLLLLFWFCLPFISKPFSSRVTAKDAERTFSSIHHITQHRLLRFPLPPFLSSSQLQGYFFCLCQSAACRQLGEETGHAQYTSYFISILANCCENI